MPPIVCILADMSRAARLFAHFRRCVLYVIFLTSGLFSAFFLRFRVKEAHTCCLQSRRFSAVKQQGKCSCQKAKQAFRARILFLSCKEKMPFSAKTPLQIPQNRPQKAGDERFAVRLSRRKTFGPQKAPQCGWHFPILPAFRSSFFLSGAPSACPLRVRRHKSGCPVMFAVDF